MKRMFTLRGVSNCGKSTKIKDIAQWIMQKYPHCININNKVDLTNGDILGVLQINTLKIGFNSAGDDRRCVLLIDDLLNQYPDIDILINSSRTKGITRQHLEQNYNKNTGWLVQNVFVEKFYPSSPTLESIRDNQILQELKSWLTGLEK